MKEFTSTKTRFVVSVAANLTRTLVAFITGLMVARGLNPSGYGDYTFLLGSFTALRSLMDMGSSSAFYTFMSKRSRPTQFYLLYFIWLTVQFVIPLAFIAALMPQAVIQKIWLGHDRGTILLAFGASFMQQQVWQTISQIGESARKTVRVQIIGMVVVFIHLALVSMLMLYGRMSGTLIFCCLIGEYLLAAIWSFWYLRDKEQVDQVPFSLVDTLQEYNKYCKPLIIAAWAGFVYEFADRWLLQRFGGAGQQGYYQIAYQFSAVSLLATNSILNIFWKEIAEAHDRGNDERVASVYRKVNRGLVMLGAIVSGLLIPWTEQIVRVFLGQSYVMAVPVLMIMFLYPIHQSMGQISGTMFLASGYTNAYMVICLAVMLVSLPITYLVQAPQAGYIVPGLGLGATGMALKMVLLNTASVNIQAWIIARYRKWKFDWTYQLVGIGSVICLGFMAKLVVGFFCDLSEQDAFSLVLPFLVAALLYAFAVAGLIWTMPWLIGMTETEMKSTVKSIVKLG